MNSRSRIRLGAIALAGAVMMSTADRTTGAGRSGTAAAGESIATLEAPAPTGARTSAGASAASDSGASVGAGSSGAHGMAAARIPDLTGYWKLDRARSVIPSPPDRRPGGMRRGPGGWGRGEWGRPGGPGRGGEPGGGRERDSDRARMRRLPELFHITQTDRIVSFEDSTGTVVQEVTTAQGPDPEAHAPGAAVLAGAWSEGRLEVERPAWGDTRIRERIALEDDGRSLVISTALPRRGELPSREIKRVYRRVTEWE